MRATRAAIVLVGGVVIGLLVGQAPLHGQHPQDQTDWVPRTLRASGQPLIPSFEGWYQNADGSYELCFGYYNANTHQSFEIPLGPDNFIEPREFDGEQPTHFDPVPYAGYRRYYCVFTVTVPEDWGDRDVRWTLRVHGETYSEVGHLTAWQYEMAQRDVPERAMVRERMYREAIEEWREEDMLRLGGSASGSVAPVLRFLQPAGSEGRGHKGITAGPIEVVAGTPLTLSVSVRDPEGKLSTWWVGWAKHQGTGHVTFSQKEMEAGPTTNYRATTRVTFDEPGNYIIRVQSIENIYAFGRQCCWTNGYVEVTVRP